MRIGRQRPPLAAAAFAALALLCLGVVALGQVRGSTPPDAFTQLQRAQLAAEKAREASGDVSAGLHEIAQNLAAGFDLRDSTGQIQELTHQQSASLLELAELLQDQLDELRLTLGQLGSSRTTAADIAALSAEQADSLTTTLSALRNLRQLAHDAAATSAELAHKSQYGARLAEDSQDSFSTP